jgi:hypothetical protein
VFHVRLDSQRISSGTSCSLARYARGRAGGKGTTATNEPATVSDQPRIDLNADVGESLGPWRMGDDEGLMPFVTSVNVACGLHAGDPLGIERTIRTAVAAGVVVGAHPGYPDLVGFGRRDLALSPSELQASIVYQVEPWQRWPTPPARSSAT